MLCQFERLIYPQSVSAIDAGSFMIAVYRPCEKIKDSAGDLVTQVKAVGYGLPIADKQRYELQGHWSRNPKHGVQFEVETYDEVITPTREGIIAYLSSGQIKGIGPKMAEKIYDAFGLTALEVLDKEPERLLAISGISSTKLKKICDSYLANRGARDVVAFLSPHGITPNRAVKLYKEYGERTMDIVKNHPYQLCEIAGIGFKTADKIAMSMGFDQLSTERVDEGILYTLTDAEGKGNLCMEKHAFVKACLKILDTPQLTEDMVANRAARLIYSGKLISYQGNVYRSKTAYAESNLAELLSRQMRRSHSYGDLEADLDAEELRLKLKLAPEQREAVKMALTQGLSVITGGPGTGKSMILRAILDIYRRYNPRKEICLCAPTGRAARRMEQSTGLEDIILVDEVSMMDIYLAGRLLEAVNYRNLQNNYRSQIAANSLPLEDNLKMQEVNYRICVLETFESLSKSAPITMDTKVMGYHYQLVDAYVKFVLTERKFGPKTDTEGIKKRETAAASFEKVVQDGRKRFSSFSPTSQDQYRSTIGNYILTVLSVWMQYRNTYINV